ncbi:adenylate kinase family protein [Terriglobus roseus]|uniref:Adenylate kinase n=1 Tax=Terriglobus roseus TaxID=392734 RepID=A0A1G7F8D1_9BACT|nr:nucleoside monophosphate kinase [Terriglobus roseus]SDE72086.1 Adenylate kinase [Terriglobus roseus]
MAEHELNQTPAPVDGFIPGPVLLLGAPGVGKGTQAQILMDLWGIPQISTGDIIRENIKLGTPVGLEFQDLVAQGIFVPDELVNRMVALRLSQPDAARGYILDGYPRTLGQAEWLDEQLAGDGFPVEGWEVSPAGKLPVIAVSIEVRYDELLRRITGRRTGPVSKRIYNIYTNPPLVEGVDDVDGQPLVQRPDDTEEVFAERMRQFADLTAPVIEHYRAQGRFEVVDGEQPVEVVTETIVAALKRLRREGM